MKRADPRRALPSVDAVLRAGRPNDVERERFTRIAREVLARARSAHASGDAATTIVLFSANMAVSTSERPTRIGQASGLCQLRTADFDDVAAATQAVRANLYVVWIVEGSGAAGTRSSSELSAGLDNLAGVTGGELIRLTGDTELAMARVGRETSAYYLAAFAADPSERNGARYRVELKVKRDRVKLRVQPQLAVGKGDNKGTPSPRDMLRPLRPKRIVSATRREIRATARSRCSACSSPSIPRSS